MPTPAERKEQIAAAMDKAHHPHLVRVNLVEEAVPPDKQLVDVWIVEFRNHVAPLRKLVKGTRGV